MEPSNICTTKFNVNQVADTNRNHSYIDDVRICELERGHAREVVALSEARKVIARRRQLHEQVRSRPPAGARHGARPPAPPHHLAAPRPARAAPRHRRAAAPPGPEAHGALGAPPRLGQRHAQLGRLVTKYDIIIDARLRQRDQGAPIQLDIFDEESLVDEADAAERHARARGGARGRGGRLGARARLAYLSRQPHPDAGGRHGGAERRERLARVRAPQRRGAPVAVDGAGARLAVRRRSGHF